MAATADSLRFEGTGSGVVYLNSAADSSIDSNTVAFQIPNGASFIEFDYKSSVPFTLGMQGYLTSGFASSIEYLAGVNPNNQWQKFYLNTTAFVSRHAGGNYYLYIKTSVPAGQTSGRLLIDNVKLITF